MSKDRKSPPSPLVEAATALEAELERVDAIAREAQRLPLNSRKNLERTATSLGELGGVDERVGPLVQRLMGAVAALVAAQQTQAEALQARAEDLQRRRGVYEDLLARCAELGTGAQELNHVLKALLQAREEAGPRATDDAALTAVHDTMTRLIEGATEASRAAAAEEFDDLARDADALRQQLLAALNKLSLLARRPAEGPTTH